MAGGIFPGAAQTSPSTPDLPCLGPGSGLNNGSKAELQSAQWLGGAWGPQEACLPNIGPHLTLMAPFRDPGGVVAILFILLPFQ